MSFLLQSKEHKSIIKPLNRLCTEEVSEVNNQRECWQGSLLTVYNVFKKSQFSVVSILNDSNFNQPIWLCVFCTDDPRGAILSLLLPDLRHPAKIKDGLDI